MITTFNRREVFTTLSMKAQSQVKDILSQNHIMYHTKTVNHSRSGDIRTIGSAGIREDYAYEYTVCVHKSDYKRAMSLLNPSPRA